MVEGGESRLRQKLDAVPVFHHFLTGAWRYQVQMLEGVRQNLARVCIHFFRASDLPEALTVGWDALYPGRLGTISLTTAVL